MTVNSFKVQEVTRADMQAASRRGTRPGKFTLLRQDVETRLSQTGSNFALRYELTDTKTARAAANSLRRHFNNGHIHVDVLVSGPLLFVTRGPDYPS